MTHDQDPRIKYYEYVQEPLTGPPITPVIPAVSTADIPIAALTLKHIKSNDRQDLKVTVNWTITPSAVAGAVVALTLAVLSQPLTLRLWRGTPGAGTIVSQVTDTLAAVLGIALPVIGTAVVFPTAAAVTTFVATDTGVSSSNKTQTYTLSAFAPASMLALGIALPTGLVVTSTPSILSLSFDGTVIDEN